MLRNHIEANDEDMLRLMNLNSGMYDNFSSQNWLEKSVEKRMIYWNIYGDLFSRRDLNILDIGGGLCNFSRALLRRHNYELVDIMAHDSQAIKNINTENSMEFLKSIDWNDYEINKTYDIIIANDLFPNVDQRLEMFINKYINHCKEIRLSLTYYDNDKTYSVKRVDADEIFNILAWDGRRLARSLEPYGNKIINYNNSIFEIKNCSIFDNGRTVCFATLVGDCLE